MITGAYDVAARGAHAAQPRLLEAWRRLLIARAHDDTARSAGRSCVVVAPHPDDETLGCGATIARKRAAGTDVTVVVVADGRYAQRQSSIVTPADLAEIRATELLAACRALGVADADIVQLRHEDTFVDRVVDDVASTLHELIARKRPREILVCSGLDHHPDHRAVNRAVHRAVRAATSDVTGVRPPPQVREYPVWSWIDGPWLDQRQRTPLGRAMHLVGDPLTSLRRGRPDVVATGEFLPAKRAALAAHASQTTRLTDEPDWAVMDGGMLDLFLGDVEVFLTGSPIDRRTQRC